MQLSYAIVYVPNVAEAVEFYEQAFGMERRFVHEAGDYAEMATGETSLAFTSHDLGENAVPIPYTPLQPDDPPAGFEFTLTTDDVEAGFRSAVAAGATPIAEPHDTEWGQTVSYVRDPHGVLIGIASPMS